MCSVDRDGMDGRRQEMTKPEGIQVSALRMDGTEARKLEATATATTERARCLRRTPRGRLLTWAEPANLRNSSIWWSRLLDHGEVAVLLLDHCNLVGAESDHLAGFSGTTSTEAWYY